MNLLNKVLFVCSLSAIWSCGPSKQELAAAQSNRDDSIRVATERSIAFRKALEDSVRTAEVDRERVSKRIVVLKAELVAAMDKLDVIRTPKFLRTPAERERQVKNQVIIIHQLEEQIQSATGSHSQLSQMIMDWRTELERVSRKY